MGGGEGVRCAVALFSRPFHHGLMAAVSCARLVTTKTHVLDQYQLNTADSSAVLLVLCVQLPQLCACFIFHSGLLTTTSQQRQHAVPLWHAYKLSCSLNQLVSTAIYIRYMQQPPAPSLLNLTNELSLICCRARDEGAEDDKHIGYKQ